MFSIKSNYKNGIHVLEVHGRVVQDNCDELEDKLEECFVDERGALVVLDLSSVPHICSAALGILVNYKKKMKSNMGDIKLVISNSELINLFEITLLNRVFDIYSLREEAVAACM